MARNTAKPTSGLTVSKTGQYTGLKAFYVFNETSGTTIANLADGTDSLTLTGGGTLSSDSTGRFYQPYGGAAATAIPSKTFSGLGVTGDVTIFCRIQPPQFSEGTDRVVFSLPLSSNFGVSLDTYGTIYELHITLSGNDYSFVPVSERPGTVVETVVLTISATTGALTAYVNGVQVQQFSLTPVNTAGKLAVGYDSVMTGSAFGNARECIYEIGVVAAEWTAAQAAAYDTNPLEAVGISAPVVPTTQTLVATKATNTSTFGTGSYVGFTRLYLPSSGTAPISPAFTAGWDGTASATRGPATRTPSGTALAASTATEAVTTNNYDVLVRQFISEPLQAQTISGRVRSIVKARESDAAANMVPQFSLRVVSGDGATVRGTLFAMHTATNNTDEFGVSTTTGQTRKFPRSYTGSDITGGATLTSVTAQAGDRLVIEYGTRANNTVSTSYTVGLDFGDPTGTAILPENQTSNNNNLPWIEFSGRILFANNAVSNDALGAGELATAAPSAGTPTITQLHQLATAALLTAAVALGSPTLSSSSGTASLTAPALSTATPSAGTPAITQSHGFSAAGLTASPTLGSVTITQRHTLSSATLTASPTLGSATVSQSHALAPAALTSSPTLQPVTITQRHALAAAGLTSTPTLGAATLAQIANLTPAAITATPVLGSPAITQAHQLAATAVTTLAIDIARPALGQGHQLGPAGVTASPTTGSPAISQLHALTASGITTGALASDSPALSGAGQLAPAPTTTGTPVLERPAITQGHQLGAAALSTAAPAPDRAALVQLHQLGAVTLTSTPDLGRPSLAAVAGDYSITITTLTGQPLEAGAPDLTVTQAAALAPISVTTEPIDLGRPALDQQNLLLAPASVAPAAPVLERPALAQHHQLRTNDLTPLAPVTGRPGFDAFQYDPLNLGDQMLVSLNEAKQHLRLELGVLDDEADIALKLDAAEAEVTEYLGRPAPWLDADGNEVPCPAPIKAAIMMVLADLYENRSEGITGTIHTINPTARRLLQRYRVFA